MNAKYWLFGVVVAVAGPVIADMDVSGKEFDQFARAQAQNMPEAHESVAKGVDGAVKWAGVWMKREQACPNGRLSGDGQRLVAEGSRFAADHGARVILFAPRADAPTMARETKLAAAKVEVRANDQIGEHCYLVIQR